MKVTTSNLQNNFGKYLKYAEKGETIIITKNSKDVATLEGVSEASAAYAFNKITYEDFLAIDDGNRYEFIFGEVYLLSAPRGNHQFISMSLSIQFSQYFSGKKCIPFAAPFDVTLYVDEDVNVVQPDISIVCDIDKFDKNHSYIGLPALVVEILSPSTSNRDLFLKGELYSKAGIKEYWIVDPKKRKIILYNYESDTEVMIFNEGDVLKSLLFSDLEVDTTDLFILPWTEKN